MGRFIIYDLIIYSMKKYFKYFKYLYFYNERIILPLKRSLNNWSYLVFILISPILIVYFVLSVIYEHTIGGKLVRYQIKKDMKYIIMEWKVQKKII